MAAAELKWAGGGTITRQGSPDLGDEIMRVRLLSFHFAALLLFAADAPVRRPLTLDVVDTRTPQENRPALRRALVAALLLHDRSTTIALEAQSVSVAEVKDRLVSGECDVVLLLSDERPWSLRRIATVTLCGELHPEAGRRQIYLVMGPHRATEVEVLARAFSLLQTDAKMLAALREIEQRPAAQR